MPTSTEMEQSEAIPKVKYELRNTHKWKDDRCVHCGCIRIWIENPNASWDWAQYVDPETGEITRKAQCHTNQLQLL